MHKVYSHAVVINLEVKINKSCSLIVVLKTKCFSMNLTRYMHYLYAKNYKRLFVATAILVYPGRNANDIVTLRGNLAVSNKVNHIFTILTSQPTP